MKNGKYSNNTRKRRLRWRKEFVLLCAVTTLVVGVIGGSLAYLIAEGGSVENTFQPAHVDSVVSETMSGNVKSNVKVTNTSDIPAFLRATISVRWEKDGMVYAQSPTYSITGGLGAGWFQIGDIYYYNTAVDAGETTTTAFIEKLEVTGTAPDGYHLVVDVLTEAIQAEGVKNGEHPVEIAWGVEYHDGTPATISAP